MAKDRDAPPGRDASVDRTAVTLTALRYLVALAECGHFGRAAKASHVSQPTLSEQIARLERVLGAALVERGRGARLTAAGHGAVERARRILREVDELATAASAAQAPLAGPFRLGVIPTLGPYLLPALLPAARAAYPDLRLHLHEALTATLLAEVADHRLDAALVALPATLPGLVSRTLFHEPFLVLLPRAHPLAARCTLAAADLQDQRLLLLDEGHCLREQALALCSRAGLALAPETTHDVRATSLETVARLVAAGLGVTLLPARAAKDLPAGLVTRPLVGDGNTPPGRTIGLLWRKSHPRPGDQQALADLLARV